MCNPQRHKHPQCTSLKCRQQSHEKTINEQSKKEKNLPKLIHPLEQNVEIRYMPKGIYYFNILPWIDDLHILILEPRCTLESANLINERATWIKHCLLFLILFLHKRLEIKIHTISLLFKTTICPSIYILDTNPQKCTVLKILCASHLSKWTAVIQRLSMQLNHSAHFTLHWLSSVDTNIHALVKVTTLCLLIRSCSRSHYMGI